MTQAMRAVDFTPDAFALRTTDAQGRSYGSFQWPLEVMGAGA